MQDKTEVLTLAASKPAPYVIERYLRCRPGLNEPVLRTWVVPDAGALARCAKVEATSPLALRRPQSSSTLITPRGRSPVDLGGVYHQA